VLLPRQETDISVRITREGRRSIPYKRVTKALKVPNLSHGASYPLDLLSYEFESLTLIPASKL